MLNKLRNSFIGILVVTALLTTSAQAADKRIGILVFDGVLTSDITAPIEVFGIASKQSWFADYETITIAVDNKSLIETEEGLLLKTDAMLKDRPEVDVLLVPSSYDMAPLLANKTLISYIQKTAEKAEWMASNCSGAFLLAEAGVLDGKQATTWAGGEQGLKSEYPQVDVQFDRNYVKDEKVITSNGSVVSYEAALALLAELSSPDRAKDVADALQFSRVRPL
ncbi:DJ-1/PfpI family protein [Motiliproteus sp. MSK22-1]|uniref:DJ-1/PfpI family protein n=1 Tax=Motiliproteus sp. MSK22-1 TaxID=1897630 RepID=UPI000978C0A2|nr:DJ-1/PfpI family protein [Motiliproteus sp. MSK22-1]OMH33578.1 transcriptional regulator [Motiliproteus sp. MSK22-1]